MAEKRTPRQGPQHRDHGPHRCRQDHHDRARPLLHRPLATRSVRSTTARPRWTGWSRSRSAASRLRRRATTCIWNDHRSTSSIPRARGLHRRGGALAARARRRGRRLRWCRRRRAAVRDGVASGRPLQRAADVLHQQAGPHRSRSSTAASTSIIVPPHRDRAYCSCRSAPKATSRHRRPRRDEGPRRGGTETTWAPTTRCRTSRPTSATMPTRTARAARLARRDSTKTS